MLFEESGLTDASKTGHQTSKTAGDAGCYWRGTVHHVQPVEYVISTIVARPADRALMTTPIGKDCKANFPVNTSAELATGTASGVSSFTTPGGVSFTTITMTITDLLVTKTLRGRSTMPTPGNTTTGGVRANGTSTTHESIRTHLTASVPVVSSTEVVTVSGQPTVPSNSTFTSSVPTMENASGQSGGRLGFMVIALSGLAAIMGTIL